LVKGHSNINLRLEILKKIILLPLVFGTALISINAMLYGLILFSIIEYFINSYYTKKLINYSLNEQFKDIFPFLIISAVTFLVMYSVTFFEINSIQLLTFQLVTGGISFIIINEILKLKEYLEIKTKIIKIYKKYTS